MTDFATITAKLDCPHEVIGPCLMIHGDARALLKLIPDAGADCIVTDPPYGHNNNNGDLISRREEALGQGAGTSPVESFRPIHNDGEEANEIYRDLLPEFYRILGPGCCCCCCCCGGGGPDPQFARWSLWMDEVFNFKQMVVWDKEPMGMGWHYRRSYETVLVGEKPGAACRWFGGSSTENIIRPGDYGIRKIIPQAKEHPCAKPVELYRFFVDRHTQPGELVVDPFMGESPCGVACIRTGRRFIGIELDPGYYRIACDRIRREWETYQGGPMFAPKPDMELFTPNGEKSATKRDWRESEYERECP